MAQITLNTGQIVNAWKVLNGTQTGAGITVNTGGISPGLTTNHGRVIIEADPANGATNVCFGDGSINNNGTGGQVLLAGSSQTLQGKPVISLAALFLSVSVNGGKVNIYLE